MNGVIDFVKRYWVFLVAAGVAVWFFLKKK